MERFKAKDLIFVSQIKRDGTGVSVINGEEYDKMMLKDQFLAYEEYNLVKLSFTKKTYVAFPALREGFYAYVVKLKRDKEFHDSVKQQENESK